DPSATIPRRPGGKGVRTLMAVFKLSNVRPLPPAPEIVVRDGKPHVRLTERGRAVFYPLPKDGTKYLRLAKTWTVEYRDEHDIVRRKKGFTDKAATEALEVELRKRVDRAKLGYADPAEEHGRTPLADHLRDYAAALEAKGDSSYHVRRTVGRATTVLTGCKFIYPADVKPGLITAWLNDIRRDRTPVPIPKGRESFRPDEAAALLGITKAGLASGVKRHRLAASGNGKARRLPRKTVETLAQMAAKGSGPATVNHYVRTLRGFFAWMVKAKRIASNPVNPCP
ncbi:MAG: hypothetical protein ACRC7O_08190, partial [Fimbriiglobus sp.]